MTEATETTVSLISDSETFSSWTVFEILILLIGITIVTASAIGNLLVIASWKLYPSIRTPSNILLVSLAVTDLLIGTISIPLTFTFSLTQNWALGKIPCALWLCSVYGFTFISSNHLVVIAIDRYRILVEGVSYLQRRSVKQALEPVIFLWIMAILLMSPIYLDFEGTVNYNKSEKTSRWVCEAKKTSSWILLIAIISILGPLVALVMIYMKVFRELKSSFWKQIDKQGNDELKSIESTDTSLENRSGNSQKVFGEQSPINGLKTKKIVLAKEKERRAGLTLGFLIVTFLVCWTPYLISTFLLAAKVPVPRFLFLFSAIFGFSNACVNPIIYTVRNQEFQKCFKGIIIRFVQLFKCW